ncbi:helix-turn-helix domain-containing protein [Saliterribacillus persicus]|uniref:Helix-turn-helix protein n=1 Tax=Saliterribacillus persicus TaxID=930114 RepID=A0A368Y489_9BACI|nr:helix-turn-helix domain-containing protein [Saliterribacillus persicus]RCW75012.1 helix-turn-helix protein [Saliterribacillus persicus]
MEQNKINNGVFLKVHLSLYTSGLATKLGKELGTLMAIASYMNEEGNCYPTQRQLAQRTGTSPNLINRHIKKLLAFRINGKPILTRKIVHNERGFNNSVYKIHPISQISIFKGNVESINFLE